jgi:hypothetical protein
MIHFIVTTPDLRSSSFWKRQLSSITIALKNHNESHGNKQHVLNTAGSMEQSKYQNTFAKKKWIGDYPREPNRWQGVSGTTPSSAGTPSATQDPLIDTVSFLFCFQSATGIILKCLKTSTKGCCQRFLTPREDCDPFSEAGPAAATFAALYF